METGKLAMTVMLCVCGLLALSQITEAKGECEYNGRTYKNKSNFKEGGNCRKCKCKNGVISCKTSKKCSDDFCTTVECKDLSCENQVTQKDLCCPVKCASGSCDYNGLTYNDGDAFASIDGCNTCRCIEGTVSCTKKGCKRCAMDGQNYEYESGESFPSSDGCNLCVCKNGRIKCSEKTCQGCTLGGEQDVLPRVRSVPSGEIFSIDCDICTCLNGDVKCTERDCPTCSYNGEEYDHEDMFGHEDGCNKCQCLYGRVECTDFDCPDDCLMNGTVIKDGQSFSSADGFNKCWCKDGDMECTDFNCTLPGNSSCVANGTVYQPGASYLNDIKEKCVCEYGEFECSEFSCGNNTASVLGDGQGGGDVYVVPTLGGPKLCLCINGTLECNSVLV